MNDNESMYVNLNDLEAMQPPSIAPRIQPRVNVVRPQQAAAKLHALPGEPLEIDKHNQSPGEQHVQPQVQIMYIVIPEQTNINSQVPAGFILTANPATSGFKNKVQTASTEFNVTAQPPVSFNPNSSAQKNGMSHAYSTLSVQSAPGGYGAECEVPKKEKKKKALTRFINFLRQLKKRKQAIDKFMDSPVARELGLPELVDGAKTTVIDGARSLIGM